MPNGETNQKNNAPELPLSDPASLARMMRENLELSREILEHTRKTRKYLLFGQILNVVKIVLIIGPIIIALIYLPPLIKQLFGTYSELLGGGTGQTILEGTGFINSIFNKNPAP
ncbi:MAG: hypothetical protein HYS45_03170 [Parcubacteria group bacterium]|nr:hypothetical protein [Parcubacteria group bacterium]